MEFCLQPWSLSDYAEYAKKCAFKRAIKRKIFAGIENPKEDQCIDLFDAFFSRFDFTGDLSILWNKTECGLYVEKKQSAGNTLIMSIQFQLYDYTNHQNSLIFSGESILYDRATKTISGELHKKYGKRHNMSVDRIIVWFFRKYFKCAQLKKIKKRNKILAMEFFHEKIFNGVKKIICCRIEI